MDRIDAIVMGRKTFEKVCGFDCGWPYRKAVLVLINSLLSLSQEYEGKAELISGSGPAVVAALNGKGYEQLYIAGGATVRSFLKEDLIDEMIITVLPILLGGGAPLFRELPEPMAFDLVSSESSASAD